MGKIIPIITKASRRYTKETQTDLYDNNNQLLSILILKILTVVVENRNRQLILLDKTTKYNGYNIVKQINHYQSGYQ